MPNKDKNFTARISITLLLLAAGAVFSLALVSTASASGITPDDVITLANKARVNEGLSPLAANAQLSEAASAKAHDMLKNDYFAHTSPSGRDPWYWIKQAGYQYKAAGENLAINFTNAKEEQSAWMKSETHRANILNAHYQEIGVAVVEGKIDGQNSIITVELFGTPMYAAADPVKTVVPPVVQESKMPEIKGVETSETEIALPSAPAPQFIQTETVPQLVKRTVPQPVEQTNVQMWLDAMWAMAMSLLFFSLMSPPLAFLCKAWQLMFNGVAKEKNIAASEDGEGAILEQTIASQSTL